MDRRFGKYILLDRLAEGGMGEVFLARQLGIAQIERLVVLKRIKPALAKQKRFLAAFVREARISSRLAHPSIAQVYEFGCIDGSYYLTLEYVPGLTLRSISRRLASVGAAWPLDVVIELVARICSGLDYVHSLTDLSGAPLKIVHCDMSPSNVMLSDEGEVKILDFGIARARGSANEGAILAGKVGYLSPEQCSLHKLDASSDLYSMGVITWELLTGHRLFPADNVEEHARLVKNARIDPPSLHRKSPTDASLIDAIVLRLLAHDRQDRFPSADAVQAKLEAVSRATGLRTGSRLLKRFVHSIRSLRHEENAAPSPEVQSLMEAPPKNAQSPVRLLVVDDEPDNLAALERTFRHRYEVVATADPEQALRILEREPIDILVTDQRMPKMNGLDLIERAVVSRPDLLKVVVSAYAEATVLLEAINRGQVDRFIVKPWKPNDVLTTIAELINEQPVTIERLERSARRLTLELEEISPHSETVEMTEPLAADGLAEFDIELVRSSENGDPLTLLLLALSPASLTQPAVDFLSGELDTGLRVHIVEPGKLAILLVGMTRLAASAEAERLTTLMAESGGPHLRNGEMRIGLASNPAAPITAQELIVLANENMVGQMENSREGQDG